ncbi:hypothetical protein SODALDRAFT_135779 [Sodiomyces alkalinus F11]|uniref:Uncharacterized protein n=1 Tax=Sodiomyces alkalinus (strain CBS 110278 / VKM F-3762 / F11) TaxID=1314773 RepID=A0A3N2PYT7_SODAK|nr:hypothetical protein SODALDRAFT_135779 [Sodiomyces alkalinus F11]ROT39693.1 hypothetical protein SODALDRAFT_135779 [Sodiomyces alkalinus F11]
MATTSMNRNKYLFQRHRHLSLHLLFIPLVSCHVYDDVRNADLTQTFLRILDSCLLGNSDGYGPSLFNPAWKHGDPCSLEHVGACGVELNFPAIRISTRQTAIVGFWVVESEESEESEGLGIR